MPNCSEPAAGDEAPVYPTAKCQRDEGGGGLEEMRPDCGGMTGVFLSVVS